VSARVIITGAAGGIGAAAAAELRSRGAQVVGLDLDARGDDILACDVRDQASVDAAVDAAVARLGGLDVLINNAGVGDPQGAGERPDGDALKVIEVNLMGPWRVTAAALPALRLSRGRVINVASGLAHVTVPMAAAYCMSKRGLVAYSAALRLEHGDAITVTTVYPGYIRTAIHDAPRARGLSLEGVVPAETVEDAARALARAALGRPVRNLATTWWGGLGQGLLAHLPGALVEHIVLRRFRRVASVAVPVASPAPGAPELLTALSARLRSRL
jgi:NAD(P)-dependent dehydrogenase (short-subunit alcohol dehydrogenase family)